MFQYPPLNPLPRPNYTPRVPFCSELPPNAPTCTLRCPTVLRCPHLHPFVAKSPKLSTTVHNCPVVAYCSFLSQTVSGCRFCFCGFLWPFVASRGLLWPFEAFCGIESHRRNLSRVSPIVPNCPTFSESVPSCPRLSDSVPFCPGNNFFQFGSAAMHRILSYFFLFRGSLVSEGFCACGLERKARRCSRQSDGDWSKTRALFDSGRVGPANCVNGSRRRFGPTQVPVGTDPVQQEPPALARQVSGGHDSTGWKRHPCAAANRARHQEGIADAAPCSSQTR